MKKKIIMLLSVLMTFFVWGCNAAEREEEIKFSIRAIDGLKMEYVQAIDNTQKSLIFYAPVFTNMPIVKVDSLCQGTRCYLLEPNSTQELICSVKLAKEQDKLNEEINLSDARYISSIKFLYMFENPEKLSNYSSIKTTEIEFNIYDEKNNYIMVNYTNLAFQIDIVESDKVNVIDWQVEFLRYKHYTIYG